MKGGAPASPVKKWTAKRIMKYLVTGAVAAATAKYAHRLNKASNRMGQLHADVGRLWYGESVYKQNRKKAKKQRNKAPPTTYLSDEDMALPKNGRSSDRIRLRTRIAHQ